jgi:hypothetical protein
MGLVRQMHGWKIERCFAGVCAIVSRVLAFVETVSSADGEVYLLNDFLIAIQLSYDLYSGFLTINNFNPSAAVALTLFFKKGVHPNNMPFVPKAIRVHFQRSK